MRKTLLLAFSLANLCLSSVWREVLSPQSLSYLYYWKQSPGYAALAALVINVLLLTVIFFSSRVLVHRYGSRRMQLIARGVFLFILLRALNNLRIQFDYFGTHHLRLFLGRGGYFVAGLLLAGIFIFLLARYGLNQVARSAAAVVLVLSPFGFIGLAEATWLAAKYGRPTREERPPAAAFQTNADDHPRLVWLIFDEMDERLTFAERPASLQLKELDRLRTEATTATNAFPPAGHTSQSIPALITGKLISAVKPLSPKELQVTIPAQNLTTGWSTQPNIFSDARALGLNTALVGWFHPYCRVIGDSLTKCNWEAASQLLDISKLSLSKSLLRQEITLLELFPLPSGWRPKQFEKSLQTNRAGHLADYNELLAEAESVAADTQFGLTFIHLPVPHPPDIYNREEGRFDNTGDDRYLDSLALADRTLGELRKTMEAARVWYSTTIVLSSDHWWRADLWQDKAFWSAENASVATPLIDHRVPFLIKLAGQREASTYSAPFNTVLTHDLILDVLKGKISTSSQVHSWLDAHRTIGESPYQTYEDTE